MDGFVDFEVPLQDFEFLLRKVMSLVIQNFKTYNCVIDWIIEFLKMFKNKFYNFTILFPLLRSPQKKKITVELRR